MPCTQDLFKKEALDSKEKCNKKETLAKKPKAKL